MLGECLRGGTGLEDVHDVFAWSSVALVLGADGVAREAGTMVVEACVADMSVVDADARC